MLIIPVFLVLSGLGSILPGLFEPLDRAREETEYSVDFIALPIEVGMTVSHKRLLCLGIEKETVKVLQTPFGQVLEEVENKDLVDFDVHSLPFFLG